jgi:uncharacterized protein YbjQ (UPF0145 family)
MGCHECLAVVGTGNGLLIGCCCLSGNVGAIRFAGGLTPLASMMGIVDSLDWNLLVESRGWIIAATAVLVALTLLQRAGRAIKRRQPPGPLHPRLAAYAGKSEQEVEADRQAAAQIVATSSTDAIAGYEIVRQIEAIFVDGYRSPEEAVMGLKVSAAGRGANAIVNLSQQRTAAGRCTAQGDAVSVRPLATPSG